MTLADDLDHIAEHIGDDQPNLPAGAKNTLLLAAKALRETRQPPRPPLPPPDVATCPDCGMEYIDHDGFGFCGCKEAARIDREQRDRIKELESIVAKLPRTADGVPVVPGMRVWFERDIDKPWDSSFTIDGIDEDGLYMQIEGDYHWHKERIESPIYSTPQAAEEASKQ